MRWWRDAAGGLLQLLFPHVCSGCGSDLLDSHNAICLRCLAALPRTGFESIPDNPIERKFWGRLEIQEGTAQYYFSRNSIVQRLLHRLKYKGDKQTGLELGRLMGRGLLSSGRFCVDALVPLPLHIAREKKRGYNQATVLCEGISETMSLPVWDDVIMRRSATGTQTHHGRIERWDNMKDRFALTDQGRIEGRHVLLVDDVITTGATLEACGSVLMNEGRTHVSIAALCYANK